MWASFQSGLQGLLVYSANQWPEEINRPAGVSSEPLEVRPPVETATSGVEQMGVFAADLREGEFR